MKKNEGTPIVGSKDINAEAKSAYEDFLHGENKVSALTKFASDECAYSDDGEKSLYDLSALKSEFIKEFGGTVTEEKYSIADIAGDGVDELLIHFSQMEPYSINWTGIIKFEESMLKLKYSFTGGGRTFATVYKDGYYLHGGAINAASSVNIVSKFNKSMEKEDLYSIYAYAGSFATEIARNMGKDDVALREKYLDALLTSQIIVYDVVEGDKHKIAVENLSDVEAMKMLEETLIEDILKLGAAKISLDELEALNVEPAPEANLEWKDLPL